MNLTEGVKITVVLGAERDSVAIGILYRAGGQVAFVWAVVWNRL